MLSYIPWGNVSLHRVGQYQESVPEELGSPFSFSFHLGTLSVQCIIPKSVLVKKVDRAPKWWKQGSDSIWGHWCISFKMQQISGSWDVSFYLLKTAAYTK